MIITKSDPFTKEEIEKLQEAHGTYIKAVIDLQKKICSAGPVQHRDSYTLLLNDGSEHADVWGGGMNRETKEITCTSMINIRPVEGNISNEIENKETRQNYEDLLKYFFQEIL